MKLRFPFSDKTIPNQYGGNAIASEKIEGVTPQSFPFEILDLSRATKVVAWKLIDYDTVPMFGFPWTHWVVADAPVEGQSIIVSADFSRHTNVPQGENSLHSVIQDLRAPWWKLRAQHTWLEQHYAGPRPKSGTHHYQLTVYGFAQPLGLQQGFSLADLMARVNDEDITEMAFQNLLYTKASTDKQSETD